MSLSSLFAASFGLLATLTQASPAPQPLLRSTHEFDLVALNHQGDIESFINATRIAVDIYGPMPSEGAKLVDSYWEAKEASKAHAWIRAQLDIDWDLVDEEVLHEIEKR